VCALLDKSIFEVIAEACKEFNKQVILPSGAIAGLDTTSRSQIETT